MSIQSNAASASFPHRIIIVLSLSATAICLACFSVSLIQLLGAFVDYHIGFVVIGAAIAGWSLSLALDHWIQSQKVLGIFAFPPADNMVFSGIAATVLLFALFLLPISSPAGFVFLSVLIATLFLCGARGVMLMTRKEFSFHILNRWVALLSGFTGLLISPLLIDISAGPVAVAWLSAGGLALAGAVAAFRIIPALLSGCAVLVLILGAQMLQWNPHALPSVVSKPLATLRLEGVAPTKHVTQWDSSMRADVVTRHEAGHAIQWVYTDLTAPVPVPMDSDDRAQATDWLRDRFPLVTFPFLVKQPGKVLAIAPVPGPETAIALNLGISDLRVLAYNRPAKLILASRSDAVQGNSQGPVIYGNVRRSLESDLNRYDLIFLPITHIGRSGLIGSSLAESEIYTKEAINSYLSHLAPQGLLAVAVADELLFVKMLLTVREMLALPSAMENGREAVLWGARLVGMPTLQDPYRYLLIVAKDPDIAAMTSRLSALSKTSFVEIIFGPGGQPPQRQIYSVLQQPLPVAKVAEIMTGYFSQRAGMLVNLEPATSMRPFFFQVVNDMHPWLKWLLAACLSALLACVLFPLSNRRGLRSPDSSGCPPLPLYLGCFAAFGGLTSMVSVGAIERFSALSGSTIWASVTVLAGMLAGLFSGWEMTKKHVERSRWIWLHLVALLLVGMLHVITTFWAGYFDALTDAVRGLAAIGVLLLLGMAMGAILQHGVRWQKEALRDLVPWAWVTYGLAGLIGVVVLQWIAQSWGWTIAWLVMAAMLLTTFSIGLWIWSPRYCQHPRTDESRGQT